jgi:AcrR family transcriptional regulator
MSRVSPAELRRKILEEAIGIVYREGVGRITMRALAESLGYSPATIYLYFRNKEELVREIALHGFSLLEEATSAVTEIEDPFEAVAEAGRRYIDFALAHPELYRLIYQEFSVTHYAEAEQAQAAALWQLFRGPYVRGIESGAFRVSDPDVETAIGWAQVHGFVQLALSGRMPPRPAQGLGLTLTQIRDAMIEQRLRLLGCAECAEAPSALEKPARTAV